MPTKVPIDDIKIGMFVAELDKPWAESSFLMQGFMIRSPEEVDALRTGCQYIYVDSKRSELSAQPDRVAEPSASNEFASKITRSVVVGGTEHLVAEDPKQRQLLDPINQGVDLSVNHKTVNQLENGLHAPKARPPIETHKLLELPSDFVEYQATAPVEEEFLTAKDVHAELEGVISESLARFASTGNLDLGKIHDSTRDMVASMIRNPDASYLLSQLKAKDSFSYSHSIAASVLAVLFGRHLGLTARELDTLALAVLLLDIGKMKIPTALLEKENPLISGEVKLLKRHLEFSVMTLKNSAEIDLEVLAIVEGHHEKFDGTGYPRGLVGVETPTFARMAAIIDFYDAVTHDRPYRPAVKPCQAINMLYDRRGTQFQQELVEEFIQCLGVYPTGSLALLSSGEVGIVISQNPVRRLRPKLLIVRDKNKQEPEIPFTRDLDVERSDEQGRRLYIMSALDAGAYGISDEDYYL